VKSSGFASGNRNRKVTGKLGSMGGTDRQKPLKEEEDDSVRENVGKCESQLGRDGLINWGVCAVVVGIPEPGFSV